jgi:hypothetical protein
VGADRRGPLVAFIVIAVIAGILLVTSVRSQAAPGWLDTDLPPTAVAAPVLEPHLWGSVPHRLPRLVKNGVALTLRATTHTTEVVGDATTDIHPAETPDTADTAAASSTLTAPSVGAGPAVKHHLVSATHPRHPATTRHAPAPTDDGAQDPPADPPPVQTPTADAQSAGRDNGRHLGWSHGHARGHAHGHDKQS